MISESEVNQLIEKCRKFIRESTYLAETYADDGAPLSAAFHRGKIEALTDVITGLEQLKRVLRPVAGNLVNCLPPSGERNNAKSEKASKS